MTKTFLIALLVLIPGLAHGSVASDFIINSQSTYNVPSGTTNVLILDLTLPQAVSSQTLRLESIRINNIGTAQQSDIARLYIYEDGSSAGWDGDENKIFTKSSSPFFEVVLASDAFSEFSGSQRIFVTVDIVANAGNGKTIKPQLAVDSLVFTNGDTGPTDESITGFERMILAGVDTPSVPLAPLAQKGEALSASAIRWYFTDLSNNEFGFKILDSNLKEVARKDEANLSYLDEMGLSPDTEYSGRRVAVFNDRGENIGSTLTVFPAVRTLALPEIKEVQPPEEVEPQPAEVASEPTLFETIQTKIADIQRQINEFINQLNELIKQSAATIFGALRGFLQSFFGK